MDRVNGADWVDIGGGRRGFRSEDLAAGVSGTEVTALWLNDLQENLANVIETAGLALAAGDWTLVERAISRLSILRSLSNIPVEGYLSSAPASPAEGTQYLIATAPTGEWADKAGQIARRVSGAWLYETPRAGRQVTYWSGARSVTLRFDGTAWAEWAATKLASGPARLANITEARAAERDDIAVTPEGLGGYSPHRVAVGQYYSDVNPAVDASTAYAAAGDTFNDIPTRAVKIYEYAYASAFPGEKTLINVLMVTNHAVARPGGTFGVLFLRPRATNAQAVNRNNWVSANRDGGTSYSQYSADTSTVSMAISKEAGTATNVLQLFAFWSAQIANVSGVPYQALFDDMEMLIIERVVSALPGGPYPD